MPDPIQKPYTLILYCENKVGLLSRMTSILTRRQINIESLTTAATMWPDVHCMTLLIYIQPDKIENLTRQIEKQIDVLKAEFHADEEVIFQEVALYKVSIGAFLPTQSIEQLVREHHARIIAVEPEFILIEKSGHEWEISELMEKLRPLGLMHFARSGRVAIPKTHVPLEME
ncbi:MAG: acetolactate synthase small subunit [Microscillaceae bacterium]